MLKIINSRLERAMPFIPPTSILIGVLMASYLKDFSFLVPWLFAFMTFTGSLSSNFRSLQQVVSHPFPLLIVLFVLHILMPIWAWGIGHITFSGDLFTITGLILGMVIPTGITSFIWVTIHKGNIALTLSIILVDTFLSPFIVPYALSLLVGEKVEMDILHMMLSLFGMVVIPSLIGMLFNQFTKGRAKEVLGAKLAPFSKICLIIVIMINGSVVAPYLRTINGKLVGIAVVVLCLAFSGYMFAFLLGKLFKKDEETVVALTFTAGMRNISTGTVLATSFFPGPVAVPIVLGMLFQQVLASCYGQFLHRHYEQHVHQEKRIA